MTEFHKSPVYFPAVALPTLVFIGLFGGLLAINKAKFKVFFSWRPKFDWLQKHTPKFSIRKRTPGYNWTTGKPHIKQVQVQVPELVGVALNTFPASELPVSIPQASLVSGHLSTPTPYLSMGANRIPIF